ncbi:retrotransposon protein, putative, ty1-copia subclass [Tanacetum coccineum]
MDGAVHTYKARLVAKGFTQTPMIDYEETFSPVADIRAIRILISIAAFYDYEIWQMDVKTAFLNGYLNEEVYMEQPEGFVNKKYPNPVCKLKRYGLNQNRDEPCVYLKASGSYVTFLILYVNDILIMRNNIPMLQDVKSYLGRCFAMKDLGEVAYILGIKIYRDRSKRLVSLCQSAYIEKILKRFYMENSKCGTIPMQEKLKLSKSQGASTPAEIQHMQNILYASAIGSIMYANQGEKNILKYLRNNKDMYLVYGGDTKQELRVSCYTDAGYLTDADDLKSQTGYVFILNGGAVDWKSTKQSIFATSSTYFEYIAAFNASKEDVWIRKFICRLGVVPTIEELINMYCDNTGAIAIAKDHGVTKGARHFRAKVHYLRETIEIGNVRIEKVDTDDNLAEPFTRALVFPKHSELTKKIGMIPASSLIRCQLSVLMKSATPTSKWELLEYGISSASYIVSIGRRIIVLEQRMSKLEQFYSSRRKKLPNADKASLVVKDKNKDKQTSGKRRQLDASCREVVAAKRMQDLMHQFDEILNQHTIYPLQLVRR